MAMSNQPPRFRQVFVMGVPHCGSTLLGKMFNCHPMISCVGEMALIGEDIRAGKPCGCGKPVTECRFWNPLLPLVDPAGRYDYRAFSPTTYERLSRHLGTEVIADISKPLVWRMLRRPFSPWRKAMAGYVLLVRDSRGVLNSAMRKGRDLDYLLDKHRKWMNRLIKQSTSLADRSILIHYEDLCAKPELAARRLCEWIGIPYSANMLHPNDAEHHFIHSSVSEYSTKREDIRLDERWRSQLDSAARTRIEAVMREIPLLRDRYLGTTD